METQNRLAFEEYSRSSAVEYSTTTTDQENELNM